MATKLQERSQPAERLCAACAKPASQSRCSWCGAAIEAGGLTVDAVLAQGPHGRVYRARDESGESVALKELQFAHVPEAEQVDAFEREASTLRTLQHPAVPRFIRSFSEGAGVHLRLYLVFEFVEGESLAARIARGPLLEPELREVFAQALEVLAFLHRQTPPLLHRDLKPQNVIIRPDGRVALVDFGSARRLASGSRTHGSTLVGTFGYMPPEQLGGTVDVTSDLYALAATILHAATGSSPADLLGPDLVPSLPQSVPASLRPLLERMLQLRPQRRLPSAAAVGEALRGGLRPGASRPFVGSLVALGALSGALALFLSVQSSEVEPVQPRSASIPAETPGDARGWLTRAKPSCNAVEVSSFMQRYPPPDGWAGRGAGAGCYALAGKISPARALIDSLPPNEQWRAAGVVFDLAHPVADSGDDVATAPIMNMVLAYWPNHFMARYHAGMSDYALQNLASAKQHLEIFVSQYASDDGFRRKALEVLEALP